MRTLTLKIIIIILLNSFLTSCGGFKYSDARDNPTRGEDRARKNVKEGKGISLGGALKRGSTNYEFSTSNPMWRASLETLDFLPLTTVDYSGGIIISDWYSSGTTSGQESIKISIRFLSNEIRTENLKIVIHKKTCSTNLNCNVILLSNSKIKEELHTTIIRKAALLEKESKKKKK
ncbi:MAG: DUF3576 domain-containing protein [Candidatus Pelagibacter sp. TMED153]|nr:MAG: DUF3576 domain-containing protein [Candidatus Pelagibacter sp. TMED153]|tara:strand:- start:3534 stop:4061 length:528 start_codon:yes stop_codon:yes gene_type:complete